MLYYILLSKFYLKVYIVKNVWLILLSLNFVFSAFWKFFICLGDLTLNVVRFDGAEKSRHFENVTFLANNVRLREKVILGIEKHFFQSIIKKIYWI